MDANIFATPEIVEIGIQIRISGYLLASGDSFPGKDQVDSPVIDP